MKILKPTQAQLASYQNIEINKTMIVKETGEVPENWLRGFKAFKTWDEFNYKCETHCNVKLTGINTLFNHHKANDVSLTRRTISCHVCPSVFKSYQLLSSYMNHMMKVHYEHLKFCCVICSKLFFNVPFLVKHYSEQHSDVCLGRVFPCLSCGLICQSVPNLLHHFTTMHKK